MTNREFIDWLRSYIKEAQETEDNILIATMLTTVDDEVQTNPYWSTVSTTTSDSTQLSYSMVVNPRTNTFSVTNYQRDENREI